MMDPPGGGPDFQIDVPWGSDATVGGPLREPLTQLRDSMGSRAPACCKVMTEAAAFGSMAPWGNIKCLCSL